MPLFMLIGSKLPGGLRLTHTGEKTPSLPHIRMTVADVTGAGGAIEADVQMRNRENLRFMRDENSLLRERLRDTCRRQVIALDDGTVDTHAAVDVIGLGPHYYHK